VCSVGYGDDGTCSQQCGGAAATYGPAGRNAAEDNACEACPTMSVGFSFDFLAVNQPFTPAAVARVGAASAADCLAEFAQIEDAAWTMAGATLNITDRASTFAACVADCKSNADCQFVTFNYNNNECWVKERTASSTRSVGRCRDLLCRTVWCLCVLSCLVPSVTTELPVRHAMQVDAVVYACASDTVT
jgi:hypothetical protein